MGIVWRGLPRGGAGLAAVTCQSFVWFWLNLGCHREERRSAVVFSPLGTFGPPAGLQSCGVGGMLCPKRGSLGSVVAQCWGIVLPARRDCRPRVPVCPGICPPGHQCTTCKASGISSVVSLQSQLPPRACTDMAGVQWVAACRGEGSPVQQLLGRHWMELGVAALAAWLVFGFLVAALLGASGEEEVGAGSSAGFRIVPCECFSVPPPVRREASHRLLLCILLLSSCAARVLSKLLIRE